MVVVSPAELVKATEPSGTLNEPVKEPSAEIESMVRVNFVPRIPAVPTGVLISMVEPSLNLRTSPEIEPFARVIFVIDLLGSLLVVARLTELGLKGSWRNWLMEKNVFCSISIAVPFEKTRVALEFGPVSIASPCCNI